MKKFCVISLMVLSMIFFVSCGGDSDDEKGENNAEQTDADQTDTEQTDDSDADTGSGDNGGNDNGQTDDNGDSAGDGDKTDSGDSADDNDADTDTGDSANDEDNTDTGSNDVIDDSKCETMVYKSKDLLVYDVNEIEMWFYDTETFDDYTDPLFFIDAFFSKNIADIKGEAVSLEGSDANKEGSNRFFLYKKPQTAEEEDYLAKSGSITVEDIDGNGKAKISTTAIVFYQIAIDDGEDYRWVEVENGKCYKLEPLEWDSISGSGE